MSEERLHAAICSAVEILNTAPSVIATREGRQIRDLLRQALADHADEFMDKQTWERERAFIMKRRRR